MPHWLSLSQWDVINFLGYLLRSDKQKRATEKCRRHLVLTDPSVKVAQILDSVRGGGRTSKISAQGKGNPVHLQIPWLWQNCVGAFWNFEHLQMGEGLQWRCSRSSCWRVEPQNLRQTPSFGKCVPIYWHWILTGGITRECTWAKDMSWLSMNEQVKSCAN